MSVRPVEAQGLIDALARRKTTTEAPLPGDAAALTTVTFTDVACPSLGSCVAVGRYFNTAGQAEGLIEMLSGGGWTPLEAPLPADADRSLTRFPGQVGCCDHAATSATV